LESVEDNEQIRVTLSVGGSSIPVEMSVPAENVKLRRMLPVIQKMSSRFIEMGLDDLQKTGKTISCKAGCGACCRQLVPIAEVEAYALRDLVERMPDERQSVIKERFDSAMEQLKASGFIDRLAAAAELESDDEYDRLVKEYFTFQIACPFLENESCSIHEARPIACREYLVTSPAGNCSTAEGTGVENVQHFFQVKEALVMLSRRKTKERLPYVPLIQLMEWTSQATDDSSEHTGKEWMAKFFEMLARYSRPLE
jgi:Fe-S-cluster containining protein